jgi:hypothetical protein
MRVSNPIAARWASAQAIPARSSAISAATGPLPGSAGLAAAKASNPIAVGDAMTLRPVPNPRRPIAAPDQSL